MAASKTSKQIKDLIAELRQIDRDADRTVKAIVQGTADQLVRNAKRNAPKELGKLAQSIGKEVFNDGLSVSVYVGEVYGAFVEFGTGARVNIPPEFMDEAKKFVGYKGGNMESFITSLEGWIKRKGLATGVKEIRGLAYVIAASILRKGLKPQPYLYPAYKIAEAELIAKMQAYEKKIFSKTQ